MKHRFKEEQKKRRYKRREIIEKYKKKELEELDPEEREKKVEKEQKRKEFRRMKERELFTQIMAYQGRVTLTPEQEVSLKKMIRSDVKLLQKIQAQNDGSDVEDSDDDARIEDKVMYGSDSESEFEMEAQYPRDYLREMYYDEEDDESAEDD